MIKVAHIFWWRHDHWNKQQVHVNIDVTLFAIFRISNFTCRLWIMRGETLLILCLRIIGQGQLCPPARGCHALGCLVFVQSTKIGAQENKAIHSNRIYHHFVQGQENPPECQRFAVHDKAYWVVEVAYRYLWHEDFPVPVQSGGWLLFSYPL